MRPSPLEVLRRGAESLSGGLQPSGELHDPVFACPTQYGGAYYAWCCSVLADHVADDRDVWRERSRRAVAAAVRHTTDRDAAAYASGFDGRTASVVSHLNHRDFTWPPILRTLLADPDPDPKLLAAVERADIEHLFRA
ncbi:MAG TPA: hypothetical protein VFU98_02855, partial [Microlunatus sp.]|nr:hypothetical protein [Microlunatus sp.]